MSSVQSKKLVQTKLKKKSLSSERFRTIFNIHRKEKTKLLHDRKNTGQKEEN